MPDPSAMDKEFYLLAREHISEFTRTHAGPLYNDEHRILEVGPQPTARGTYRPPWHDTLDIMPGSTFQADITRRTPIKDSAYDVVICCEVLEHTVQPFYALEEIRRILCPGGLLIASAPMNFREHGPLPDCWRFTRHGWRVLLCDWDDVELDVLMTPDRFLMPLHICVTATCNKTKRADPRTMTFPLETT